MLTGAVTGRRWWHHDGQNAGFTSFAGNFPDQRRRIVVLRNTDMVDATFLEPLLG